jgi:hypothetical protein
MAKRRCFISAKYGTDLSALQSALEANRIEWQWAEKLPTTKPLSESVLAAISRSQFLLAVADDEGPNANVWFEVGYAVGQGVPVVLLSGGKTVIPFDMASVRYLQTDVHDEKLLTFQIDLLLRSLKEPKPRTSKTPRSSKPSGLGIGSPSSRSYASELEESVATRIVSAGGRVTIPNFSDGKQPADLLMWLPEQESELFNPAAIEIKARVTPERLSLVQINLSSFVRLSGFGCGLVVIDDAITVENARKTPPIPLVFVISLKDFQEKLRKGELGFWIRHERNRLAHGVR